MQKIVRLSKQHSCVTLILIAVAALTFLPRVFSLHAHWSSDETTWLFRSYDFAIALQHHVYSDTFQSYHPGVTTMWLGGLALWREYGSVLDMAPKFMQKKFLAPQRLAHTRLPVALMTALTILLAGLLLQRLFGSFVALAGTLFLALDPFFLAESRRLHTDALATGFLMISLLSWLCYLEADVSRRRFIIFSGISFGLACLSKSLAGGFLCVLPLVLIWYANHRRSSVSRLLWATLLWGAVSLMTALTLWPYFWTWRLGRLPMFPLLMAGGITMAIIAAKQHRKDNLSIRVSHRVGWGALAGLVLVGMVAFSLFASRFVFERLHWALTTPHEVPQLFSGQIRYAPNLLYYPVYGFVWSAPLTLPLAILATWMVWKQRKQEPKLFRAGVALVIFGVFYLFGLTVVAKKLARYLVISFPVWNILAAIGVVILIRRLSQYRRLTSTALTILLLIQAAPVLSLHPNYRSYHHPLFTSNWIAENTSLGGGTGLDIAAAYLNEKPDAAQMTVRVTRFGGFFQHYFIGQTQVREATQALYPIPDYDVVYIRDKQVDGIPRDAPPPNGIPTDSLQLTDDLPRQLENVVRLNGIDYVWIYRVQCEENQRQDFGL